MTNLHISSSSVLREILITRLMIYLSLILDIFRLWELSRLWLLKIQQRQIYSAIEISILIVVSLIFYYGSLVYQFARLGYLKRKCSHRPASLKELDTIYDGEAALLAVLIPSYKEETEVIEQALLSAALQNYPNKRVVLLIDDPPQPTNYEDQVRLETARKLPQRCKILLQDMRNRMEKEWREFLTRKLAQRINFSEETLRLSQLYSEVSDWFNRQAFSYKQSHTDVLFKEKVFLEPSLWYAQEAANLASLSQTKGSKRTELEIEREYRRLNCLFRVDLTSFERKCYINLSHEANKAMNLNSYIDLSGKSWQQVVRDGSLYLEESVPGAQEDFHVPDASYLILLDADSLICHEYALRLVHVMSQPGNEKLGIVQTPYAAIPNAPGALERTVAATVDIHHLIYLGFTSYGATFWIGANALLRKSALEDIRTIGEERGFPVTKYIQDRTVIEDTESTVDLIDRGWQLYNYPERLSYSAVPSDFGSLLIQRRRWANGGLLILPKLLNYLFGQFPKRFNFAEAAIRIYCLTSMPGVCISLIILLVDPLGRDSIGSPLLLILCTVNYYFLPVRDVLQNGYYLLDLFRIYAVNWLLLPVVFSGVLQSIHQGITGKKAIFVRTPKIREKTGFPASYAIAEYTMLLVCLVSLYFHVIHGHWMLFGVTLLNVIAIAYAITRFIGLRDSISAVRLRGKSTFLN